ncbi:hypothetical protein ACLQ3F_08350 [Micromonospora sp. DT15]|uniref:hypothetical protein n=1 Tax=Micromonospora sp. DT15 TaxID=3393445 RepID=UPI003CF8E260
MAHVAQVRRPYPLLVAAAVLLALGAATAWGVGDTLGLSHSPAAVPREDAVAAPARTPAPVPPLASLVVPDEPRVQKAATAVADAVVLRGLPRPVLVSATSSPARSTTAAPGTGRALDLSAVRTLRAGVLPTLAGTPESYRLDVHGAELAVQGGDVAGVAAGMYRLADRIRSGAEALPASDAGRVVIPRLGLRLTDAGSVGREADPTDFAGDDYGLNTDVVGSAVLPGAPWADAGAVARIDTQFRQFVDHSVAQGFNGIVVPGFLEYVTFAKVGDGRAVYPPGDPHVDRARAMVAAFGPVFRYAEDMGMRVFLLTDMLAVSPPLEAYLTRTVGGLDVADPRLWSVYQAGLAELFESMPFVDGLMVRVGEGGEVYAGTGWDYSSRLAVTTEASVRAMLRALLDTAGPAGKEIIFRTWTVGVGAVGDLHTNPASYAQVLGGLDDPHLVVSTKYTLGDFYSHLPLNTTLLGGGHRRIVEFQARREFEAFGSLPNDLGPLHSQALRAFLAANPNVEGVWNWTQDGGPLRAGPMSLYLRAGFWQLYDLNTYAVGRLAWDPYADPAQVTADWAYRTFSGDPETVAAIGQAMALSRQAVTKGLYIGPYADRSVRALGLEPPPMMWIFEWDIPTGDSAALDSIYAVTGDRVDEAIEEGTQAVVLARRMRDLVAATEPATWRDAQLRGRFTATLDYQVNLFETLSAYRTMVLRHAQWLDTGAPAARHDWQLAAAAYHDARDTHRQRYAADLDLPAYNFTAADLGARRADRDPAMAWAARAMLGSILLLVLLGLYGSGFGGAAARGLLVGALRPWRVAALPTPMTRADRVLVWLVPALVLVASRLVLTWFAAPAHLLVTLGGWALFALVVRLVVGRRDPFHLWAVVGGVALLRSVLLLAALAGRGPGGYWFAFWTMPGLRAAYVTVAFAAFCWLFVAVAVVLRDRYDLRRRSAVGLTLTAAGVPLGVLSALVSVVGLERALTVWNDQLTLLPWGLSRILGITVHLGIPAQLPAYTTAAGIALAAAGLLLSLGRHRQSA